MKRNTAIVSFLLCFLAGAIAMIGIDLRSKLSAADTIDNPATWNDLESSVPASSDNPMWGAREAPVTIVLFSDFKCPHCKHLEETIEEIKSEYGPHKVRVVFRHAPIVHKDARGAHEAAAKVFAIAGADKYWAFHRLAFENNDALKKDSYDAWAKQVGVDLAAFHSDDIEKKGREVVEQDLALARKLAVRGTPTAFVNGLQMGGYQPASAFRSVIDKQLEEAAALVKGGTPADRVYVTLSLKNKPKKEDSAAPEASAVADDGKPAPKKDRGVMQEDDPTAYRAVVGKSPMRGPKDALVTIVEFASFECRFSSQSQETLREVVASYKDDVRVVFKHRLLPYLKRSAPAALLAELARAEKGDDGFWAAHDALFKAEQSANDAGTKEAFTEENLVKIGTDLGLDAAKVRAVVADGNPSTPTFEPSAAAKKYMTAIEADGEAADSLDAEATPHFFINGRRLVGAQGADKFKAVIDEELKKAKAKIDGGVAKGAFYDGLMEGSKEPDLPATKLVDPAPADAPWKGAENAKVTVHIFSDFECPFCKQVTTTLGIIEETYKDRLKFVWRDRPLAKHTLAPLAANAAREAFSQKGNAGFWAFHDAMFELTKTPEFNRSGFEKLAEKQGLDMAAFKKALDDKPYSQAIEEAVKRADSAGIGGTPSFVFTFKKEGEKLMGFYQSGALAPSKFRRTIRLALAVANGTRPAPAASEGTAQSGSDPVER